MDSEYLEGKVFNGCLECGEEYPENGERHKPTCSRVTELLDQMENDREEGY